MPYLGDVGSSYQAYMCLRRLFSALLILLPAENNSAVSPAEFGLLCYLLTVVSEKLLLKKPGGFLRSQTPCSESVRVKDNTEKPEFPIFTDFQNRNTNNFT